MNTTESPVAPRKAAKAMKFSELNPQLLRELFDKEGYVILKGVLTPTEVQSMQKEMEKLVDSFADRLLSEGKISDPLKNDPFETRLYHLYKDHIGEAPKSFRHELHGAGLFNLFFNPRVLDMVEIILGPELRLYPNYTARPKFPDWEGTLVPWHQDGGYTEQFSGGMSAENLRMVNVWSPLVPARVENGCMQFVPGTHKLGSIPHVAMKHYLEIAPEHMEPHVKEAVDVELDPGDVVLFNNMLFHRGMPNTVNTIRWSIDWRYQDATQSTLRKEEGHIARSRQHPEQAVQSPEQWANLTFR